MIFIKILTNGRIVFFYYFILLRLTVFFRVWFRQILCLIMFLFHIFVTYTNCKVLSTTEIHQFQFVQLLWLKCIVFPLLGYKSQLSVIIASPDIDFLFLFHHSKCLAKWDFIAIIKEIYFSGIFVDTKCTSTPNITLIVVRCCKDIIWSLYFNNFLLELCRVNLNLFRVVQIFLMAKSKLVVIVHSASINSFYGYKDRIFGPCEYLLAWINV